MALVVAGPVPDPDALGAVSDCLVHVEELDVVLLICYDDIHVVDAAEAMVRYGEQGVTVWWQVDSDHFGAFVGNHVEEAGVLVSETVVILSPDGRGDENVQGGDLGTPFHL